ncbi:rhamnulokinase [Alicyclobacillus cycloheptanicus]|nr:rhamnulokinase family protein [Alicyclobacillus cycloheptanicus]WDM00223.1 rhamnulokinase [Alicyclobacillus cycloheptanicus]
MIDLLNLLAIDLGASSGRVMHAAFNGDSFGLQEVRRFHNHPLRISNRLYWNVYSLLQEMKWGIEDAARTYGAIASFATDSWAVDYGLVDTNGHLIDLPRHYRDPRNPSAMEEVIRRIGRGVLFQRTGIQLNPINSLYQLYAMRQQDENLLAIAETLLLIPDLLNFFLCGEKAAEFTNATTTQFLRPDGEWDTELLTQLGLPIRLLPRIAQPAQVLGGVRDEELRQLPSFTSTKVVHTASHDTGAAVLSIPHGGAHYAYISSGTWSLMGTVVNQPVITEQAQRFNLTNEGGLGNYRLQKNIMGLWLVQEAQRILKALGEPYDIELLLQLARLAEPFLFVFNPDDTRLLQPLDMPAMIRRICHETGQKAPADAGQLIRGILESLALKYRQVLEELELVTGVRYDSIHVVGGGSQNQLLSQFTANATQRVVITGPVEASAMGNVVGQLLALGEVSSVEQVTALIRRSVQVVSYMPQDAESWDAAYERFQQASRKQAEISTSL